MQREIKFRGICVKTNKWVYGYYVFRKNENTHKIYDPIEGFWHNIQAETVGQYTGLHDRTKWEELTEDEWVKSNLPSEWKGRELFGGDKIRVTDNGEVVEGDSDTGVGVIMFAFGMWYVSGVENSLYDINDSYEIELIGNVTENPEMITGGD